MPLNASTIKLPVALARFSDDFSALGVMGAKVNRDSITLRFAGKDAARTAKNLVRSEVQGYKFLFDPQPAAGRSGKVQALEALKNLPGVSGATMHTGDPVVINTNSLEIAQSLADLLRPTINGREVNFAFSTPPNIAL